ncbi:LBP / BPI / CETP family N-terminal domain protein [Acanthocheilonema viteae]|uniref:Lipid-binding serum glycoprotein N-terminal domain-containing protein n=1 Tax=Acanthocheilonema viteae TaxID=6277 RepID=A0A498S157_ACAVI|nr:unnamed protein product [Acanthocheilonema viteae]
MRIQFLLIIQIFIICSSSETTLRLRLNQKCSTFIASVMKKGLQNEMMKISSISPQKIPFGSGYADVEGMRVESFESPDISIFPAAPDGFVLSTNGGSVTISGSSSATYTFLWTMYFRSNWSIKMDGIKVSTRINLVSQNGKLQLNFKECQLKVENINLRLYGGIGAWIANHFTGGAEKNIRKSLKKTICAGLKNNIVRVNKNLWLEKTQINLIDNVFLTHQLLENPKVTKDFIQFDFSAYLTFGRSKCYLPSKGIDSNNKNQQTVSNHMAILWLGEPMINCYLKTWYELTNHHLNIENNKRFLDLYNSICEKKKECIDNDTDENQLVDVDIYLLEAPILYAEYRIYVETSIKVVFYQSPKNSSNIKLRELDLRSRNLLNVTISQGRINVRTEKVELKTTHEHDTEYSHLLETEELDDLIEQTLKKLQIWEITINIPLLAAPHFTLSNNATFTGIDNFIRADVDFTSSDQ